MSPLRRYLVLATAVLLTMTSAGIAAVIGGATGAAAATVTTAWLNGAFSENTGGVVSRSDIVLGQPNTADTQSLPLGNGSLGVAAWAAGQQTLTVDQDNGGWNVHTLTFS